MKLNTIVYMGIKDPCKECIVLAACHKPSHKLTPHTLLMEVHPCLIPYIRAKRRREAKLLKYFKIIKIGKCKWCGEYKPYKKLIDYGLLGCHTCNGREIAETMDTKPM